MSNTDPRKGWPVRLAGFFEEPPSKISVPLSVLAISIFVALIIIAVAAIIWLLADLLNGDQKRAAEATKAFLPVLVGLVGLPLIIWRLLILDRQTKISEEKTQIDRETHYTSIFSRSIDQLGQTREVKKTTVDEEGTFDTTTTVPNIEVRLGGIHSLSRLAEESVRDRQKIKKTLLSYVRENSWLDRNGVAATPIAQRRLSAWDWQYAYLSGKITEEAETTLNSWTKDVADYSKRLSAWAAPLPETRVDVNEAIEAIPSEKHGDGSPTSFYECLFVGNNFKDAVNSTIFERCTFVRCTFKGISDCRFVDARLIGCTVTKSNDLIFTRCTISGLSFDEIIDAKLTLTSCNISELGFYNVQGGNLNLSRSSIRKFTYWGKGITEVNLTYAAISEGYLADFKAHALSEFTKVALANLEFSGVDLSEVKAISDAALAATKSNPASLHPLQLVRPPQWKEYDPDFREEDIPF